MNQFLYFVVLTSNIDLLKEEIKTFYPFLHLSFSKKNFITFKNTGEHLSEDEISKMKFAFALDWGESGKIDATFIEERLKVLENGMEMPSESPSRAYLKLAQACELFDVRPNTNENWVEFGCAPGGAIYYLLNNFGYVIGVDPAEIDPVCLDNERFTHLQAPIQSIKAEQLKRRPIHWVASDLNLNPKQAISEVLKHCQGMSELKGIFMTIKLVKVAHVKLIRDFEGLFQQQGLKTTYCQLPAHKREFLIFARR
jgi:hypothetical protein